MFFSNICQAINLIGNEKFIDNAINIELNDDANFFLYELDYFENSSIPRNHFTLIYEEGLKPTGLLARGVKGLSISKTEYNSCGDNVSPEFILGLKKATHTYLVVLASNWELDCKFYDTEQLNYNHKVEIKNQLDRGGAQHYILHCIASNSGLEKKISIKVFSNGKTIIKGEWKCVKHFLSILSEEAQACEPFSLSKIMRKYLDIRFFFK